MQNSKRGVSLVVVLLFMLVATIAATATFRWLTAQSKASASRMVQSEAYQSAVAGIEAARSWMTFHGNDLGGIIQQYFVGDKKPILLNSALPTLNRSGQKYDVWLVGVDVSNTDYKLKLVSQGVARDSSKHSEVAVLNVSGLYRVRVPSNNGGNLNFEEAFFGSVSGTQAYEVNSGIINGDVTIGGAYASSADHIVVTGNLIVNSNTSLGDAYVKGSVCSCTNFHVERDARFASTLYVGGGSSGMVVDGDLFLDKGVDFNPNINVCSNNSCGNGSLTVGGDMTSLDDVVMLNSNSNGYTYTVYGNLVVNDGQFVFPTKSTAAVWPWLTEGDGYKFSALGNVYVDGGVHDGTFTAFTIAPDFNFGAAGKIVFLPGMYEISSANGGLVYPHWQSNNVTVNDGKAYYPKEDGSLVEMGNLAPNTYCNKTDCAIMNTYTNGSWYYGGTFPFFDNGNDDYFRNEIFAQINGNYKTSISSSDTVGWWANPMTEYAEAITEESNGNCSGAHIADPIQFNDSLVNSSELISIDHQSVCTNEIVYVTQGASELWGTENNGSRWGELNRCFELASEANHLYEDSWLLIEFGATTFANYNGETISHNMIIIFDEYTNVTLPPTTSSAYVIMYFKKGGSIEVKDAGSYHNFFFFSKGDLDYNDGSSKDITGSIFLSDCHSITSNNKVTAEYNSNLTAALTEVGVICNYDGTGLCSVSSGTVVADDSESSGDVFSGVYDSSFVAIAPQVGVSLVSQYRNNELDVDNLGEGDYSSISPSILILPRIVYLTRDAEGKLPDYYNVINLNGANESKTPARVACSPSLPTTGALYDGTNLLSNGIYLCTYSSSDYGDASFYVNVSGTGSTVPKVHFESAFAELTADVPASINLVVPASTQAQNVSVNVLAPSMPTGWNYVANSTYLTWIGDNLYTATVTPSATSSVVAELFTVSVESGTTEGTATFQLTTPCDGCVITSPDMETAYISGVATVVRAGLEEYCEAYEDNCPSNGEYDRVKNRPNCDGLVESGDVWIKADGMNCRTTSVNHQWRCGLSNTIKLKSSTGYPEEYCDLYLPTEDNSIAAPDNDGNYTLYAELKRKPYTLHVDLKGTNPQTVNVYTSTNDEFGTSPDYECSDETNGCDYTVYAGYYVKLEINEDDDDNFSYWRCAGEDCVNPTESGNPLSLLITSNNSVTAYFGENDKHCFYDSFDTTGTTCATGKYYCVDRCTKSGTNCTVTDGVYSATAKWLLMNQSASDRFEVADSRISLIGGSNTDSSAFIMSTNQAGATGTLKTMFQTQIVGSDEDSKTGLNSGFVLRANENGSNYFMLNVFGVSEEGILHVRLCKSTSRELSSTASCEDRVLKDSDGNTVSITTQTMILMTVELAQASQKTTISSMPTSSALNVSLEVGFGGNESSNTKTLSTSFDLSTLFGTTWNDVDHEYLGFKLGDEAFKIYDLGWKSAAYADSCWETYPTASCSFKANYLGGIVPKDKDVEPWVGLSSWFQKKDCRPLYYYNEYSSSYGGRNTASKTSNSVYGEYLTSDNDTYWLYTGYNFNTEGMYGYSGTKTAYKYYNWWTGSYVTEDYTGMFYDAAVKVYCPDQTLRYHTESKYASYTAGITSCGTFYVGDVRPCSENVTFDASDLGISANTETVVSVANSGVVNVRDSKLYLVLDNSNGGTVTVRFIDANENQSLPIRTTKTGSLSFETNAMLATNASAAVNADEFASESFDPQRVTGIVVSGTKFFTLVSAGTTCPNSLNISDCAVSYNGTSWEFSASIENAASAKTNGCSISGDFVSIAATQSMDCPTTNPAAFSVSEDVYSSLTTKTTYNFTISAQSENETVSCEASTELSPTNLVCYISAESVQAGSGTVPSLKYAFNNCPAGVCSYTVNLTGPDVSSESQGTFYSGEAVSSWSPADLANSASSPLAAGEYTYTLTPTQPSNLSGCTYSFTVSESEMPTISSCAVTNAGAFTATVSNISGVTYDYTLSVTDNLGNVIANKTVTGSTNATNFANSSITPPTASGEYSYALSITYGEENPSTCQAELAVESSSSSSSEEESSSSSLSSSSEASSSSAEVVESSSSAETLAITCGVSTYTYGISGGDDFYTNQSLYFIGKNNVNEGETYTVNVYRGSTALDDATISSYTNASNLASLGKLSEGSYTFHVMYNNAVICSHSITVVNPVGCSVSASNIGLGESVTISTTYSGNCWGSSFTASPSEGSGVSNPGTCQSSYTVTPTVAGTYTYKYAVTNGSDGVDSCSQTVTVERVAPTFTCPSNAKASIGASDNVALNLSGVSGCDEGGNYCYYSISGTDITASGNSYTGGTLPAFTDGNVTSAESKTYTVRLTNSVGYVEHDCSVEFVEGSASPDYTICLDKADKNGWPEITSGISAVGTYEVLHDCQGTESYSYFYNCSNGADITWDGTALICDGSEHQATAANMPPSGSILTINSDTIYKIGCGYGSGTSP
ncbi:MAG: hypothetical protein J6Z31_06135, partial [Fibrobacter sp.]|nr:hypothetical protein [Fibrobacter sp.]